MKDVKVALNDSYVMKGWAACYYNSTLLASLVLITVSGASFRGILLSVSVCFFDEVIVIVCSDQMPCSRFVLLLKRACVEQWTLLMGWV